MTSPHDFLATVPFDLYQLSLFSLVAREGSFTRAAEHAGLTQSAITRQIQGIEAQLGTPLFERTTRRVVLTPTGRFLLDRSREILREVDATLRQLREEFTDAPRTLSIGVSRSVGLAYLPGLLVAFRRRFPEVRTRVVQLSSPEILAGIDAGDLHVGVLCPPPRLPAGLRVTHRFGDDFTLIAPPDLELPAGLRTSRQLLQRLADQEWLLLEERSNTGKLLRAWLAGCDAGIRPAMEADTFDLIVNLVAMGMGCSIVPHRALALYPKARAVQRAVLRPRLTRELVVVTRKDRRSPEHIAQFIESILFT